MSPVIAREDMVRRMARTLRPLPDAEWLACPALRDDCYVTAGFALIDIIRHDDAAVRVERLRREAFAAR